MCVCVFVCAYLYVCVGMYLCGCVCICHMLCDMCVCDREKVGADWYRPLCQSLSLSLSFSPSPSPSSPISLHGWPSGLPDAQLLIWRPPRRPITGPAGPPGEFPGVLTSCC